MATVNGLYACDSCNATLSFASKDTQWMACGGCGTVHYRYDGIAPVRKPVKAIRTSNDLIQPGTTGRWQGKAFRVLGRVRYRFADGLVNFWTVMMEDGLVQYLSEGYGLYAMLVKLSPAPAIDLKVFREAGEHTEVGGQKNVLESIARSVGYEVEAEAWDVFGAYFDQKPVFYDFARLNGDYITLATVDTIVAAFEVHSCTFAQLQLQQLNEAAVIPEKIVCNRCKNRIELVSYPYAESYACQCGAKLELEKDGEFRKDGAFGNTRSAIRLGAAGVIKGISYTLIGYAVKQDNTQYKSKWREYVLYNRAEGYAWLSEYEGNWIYSREREVAPVIANKPEIKEFSYKRKTFRLYSRYGYRIVAAEGEFPGKAFGASFTRCREFIHPPYMWAEEEDSKEQVSYYQGEYIDRKDLEKAFGVQLPKEKEMGMLSPPFIQPGRLVLVTFIAALVLLGVHLLSGRTGTETMVLEKNYGWSDAAGKTAPVLVSETFSLPNWRNNVEVSTHADVNDSWVGADFELVNAETGEAHGLSQGVEYYHGYEDGESWSEGSNHASDVVSGLPAGKYFLRTQLSQDSTARQQVTEVSVKLKRNVAVDSNFYLLLGLLLIWPVVTYIRVWMADKARWYNSDYSPYTYDE